MLDVYRVEILDQMLRWIGPEGRLLDERPLVGVDTLVAEVEHALGDLSRKPNLRSAGRMLYRWLDGERRWLAGVLELGRGFTLQIDVGKRLGHLPWELCCDEGHFLVDLVGQPFHPVRRVLARRPEPSPCANRPLRILFAAFSPEDVHPVLAFEEEEIQILTATRGHDIEMVVEESGSLEGLKSRLLEYGAGYFDVLHLSGHALVKEDQPLFIMEDWLGQRQDVTAEQVADALAIWPRLIFLSGCETGRSPDRGPLPSFCERLVEAGAPLVLGWSEPVGDRHAIEAAVVLYRQLATGGSLDRAITLARLCLLDAKSPYWFLLRCYGDDSSSAPLVTPIANEGRARLLPRPLYEQFIDAGAQKQVCGPESFVGRRRILQRCLRSLVGKPDQGVRIHDGLLLTGMGGLGKSSLALRLCGRLNDHRLLVWVGRFDELDLLIRLSNALAMPELEKVLFQPDTSLTLRLCNFFDRLKQPLVLVFDDFEQNGEQDPTGQPNFDKNGHLLVHQGAQATLRDLLEAIRKTSSSCRVVITCRYAIAPLSPEVKLHTEPLDHLSGADLIKKLQRLPGFAFGDHADLAARAWQLADGNPRLLEILDTLLNQIPETQIGQVLGQLEAAAASFREQTLLFRLLQLLDNGSRLLLAKLILCRLPIPATVLTILADETTRTHGLDRAACLGLVERISSEPVTVYVSHLMEPLLTPMLGDTERRQTQGDLANQLYCCWWSDQVNWEKAIELRRLALVADQVHILGKVTSPLANFLNRMSRYEEARALCQETLNLVTDSAILTELGFAEMRTGLTQDAKMHLEEAIEFVQSSASADDLRDHSDAHNYLALLVSRQGELERALVLWQNAVIFKEQICDTQGKAVILQQMAYVIAQLGEIDRAFALWQESFTLCDQIGDLLGKSSSLHQLAGLYAQRGEIERALALWQESLIIKVQIGDTQGKAAILLEEAGVFSQRGDVETALALYQEALELQAQIGNSQGKAAALSSMARLIAQRGEVERALTLWKDALALNEQIEDLQGMSLTIHEMASVFAQRGEVERALSLWENALELEARRGDVRGKALVLNGMAGVIARRGELKHALALWQESLALEEKIGDVQGKSAILTNMAWVIAQMGDDNQALEMWQESLELSEQIGNLKDKAYTLINMAEVVARRGDVQRAVNMLQESYMLSEQIDDVYGKAIILGWMACLATQEGKHQVARSFSLLSIEALAKSHAWPAILRILQILWTKDDELALQQALWLIARIHVPLEDSMYILSFAIQKNGNDPCLQPLLVATSLYLVQTQKQKHVQLAQFRQATLGMLLLILPEDKRSKEGAREWIALPEHRDPHLFLPRLSAFLEKKIGDRWYFDRSPLLEHSLI